MSLGAVQGVVAGADGRKARGARIAEHLGHARGVEAAAQQEALDEQIRRQLRLGGGQGLLERQPAALRAAQLAQRGCGGPRRWLVRNR